MALGPAGLKVSSRLPFKTKIRPRAKMIPAGYTPTVCLDRRAFLVVHPRDGIEVGVGDEGDRVVHDRRACGPRVVRERHATGDPGLDEIHHRHRVVEPERNDRRPSEGRHSHRRRGGAAEWDLDAAVGLSTGTMLSVLPVLLTTRRASVGSGAGALVSAHAAQNRRTVTRQGRTRDWLMGVRG